MLRFLTKPALREWVWAVALLAATLAMILAPQKAMEGASTGLALCGNVIIPSLFPFLILSSLVVELGMAARLGKAMGPIMRPLFRVNGSCACALALGFIGGYPVGARTAISLYRNGLCSRTEAQRLLAFCNNSGPAFILGVVGAGVFSDSRVGLLLYLVHAAASLCVGLLFRFYGKEEGNRRGGPSAPIGAVRFSSALTGSVSSALQSTLGICSFVVFFSVVISLLREFGVFSALAGMIAALLQPLGMTQEWASRLLTGALEVSSGVWSLSGAGTLSGKLSMAAFMLGWAGISVHCQVLSFLSESGLSMNTYLAGKILHALFSAGLTSLALKFFPFSQPVSAYLTDTVDTLGMLDFSTTLSLSGLAVGATWMIFLLLSAAVVQKSSGKGRRKVV